MAAKRAGGAAASGGTLPLTLRADNTGTVRYLGYIPMQPAQMTAGGAANWKVTRNDTSAELAIHTTERGLHLADSSVMGVHLQVEATAAGSDIPCTLHLNSTRTQNLASAQAISAPAMDYTNWRSVAYTQGIVACTDADHLCASQVYPNLKPRDSAAVAGGASWMGDTYALFETLETAYYEEYSTTDVYISTVSATSYDRPAVYVQYYLLTGEIQWLDKARRCWYKVRDGSYWSAFGATWNTPEQVNFDDTYALSYLFWNDSDSITKGLSTFILDSNLCANYTYEWGIATDYTNQDISFRKYGRFLRMFTWAHRLNVYDGVTFNGQNLAYWSAAWRDRIWSTFNGWDVGSTGRPVLQYAGPGNVGTVDYCQIFTAGIMCDGLTMYSEYVTPISGAMATRYTACLDYLRTQYATLLGTDVTPRIKYVDAAGYKSGGEIPIYIEGENVCLDLFLAWMWARQGGAAATQAATSGGYVLLTPTNGKTGPYISNALAASSADVDVSSKIFDEIFHRAFLNIGALLS